ncbi:MAG: GDP-L-fucose synthase [Magnetococcales bacterium]|nr:GDP-L-fucose synthase [Magnetococcales bacterium]
MGRQTRIFVAGHRGLVGSGILRRLQQLGHEAIITRTRAELDLTEQAAVRDFFRRERPELVFLAAAKVGGIHANSTYPAQFIRDNLVIQTNLIDAAWREGVRKLMFLGSSCIYPRGAPQPMREEYLLTGPLEETNQWYAVAKIAGIKMCQAYRAQYGFDAICLMPTNLYGPGDNFHPLDSHVLPALIRRFHEAKEAGLAEVVVWGSGRARREFLHVDDLAAAACTLMAHYSEPDILNVGVGEDIAISELVMLVREVVGFPGRVLFDTSQPDGMPVKRLDVGRIAAMGWRASIPLKEGLASTYRWFLQHQGDFRQ